MATVKTAEKALVVALDRTGQEGNWGRDDLADAFFVRGKDRNALAEDIIANLPENCLLITDVKAFRTVLTEALGSSVADLGPKVETQILPKRLRVRMRELLETLED